MPFEGLASQRKGREVVQENLGGRDEGATGEDLPSRAYEKNSSKKSL